MAWALVLYTQPVVCFYDSVESIGSQAAAIEKVRLVSVPEIREELRISGGENSSATLQLENGDGALTALLSDIAPHTLVQIFEGSILRLTGEVASMKISTMIELVVEP